MTTGGKTRGIKALLLLAAGIIYPVVVSSTISTAASTGASTIGGPIPEYQASQRARRKPRSAPKAAPQAPKASATFNHNVPQHKQACDSCHKFPSANWNQVRKGDDAFPDITDYPQHSSCIGCHQQQFFTGASPAICSVCHVQAAPRNSTRYPFPNPREIFDKSPRGQSAVSEYRVYFPHEPHMPMFGEAQPAPGLERKARMVAVSFQQPAQPDKNAVCAKCHQNYQPQGDSDDEYVTKAPSDLPETRFWLKKGTFKSAPQNHTLCFTCHSQDGGLKPASTDCGICHKLMTPQQFQARSQAHADFDPRMAVAMGITDRTSLQKWARRDAVRFRHEWVVHADLTCTDCHDPAKINTADDKGPAVAVLSCGGAGSGCHISQTKEEGGALNLEIDQKKTDPNFQCTKCHALRGKQPIPESHLSALTAIKEKK